MAAAGTLRTWLLWSWDKVAVACIVAKGGVRGFWCVLGEEMAWLADEVDVRARERGERGLSRWVDGDVICEAERAGRNGLCRVWSDMLSACSS